MTPKTLSKNAFKKLASLTLILTILLSLGSPAIAALDGDSLPLINKPTAIVFERGGGRLQTQF